MEGSGRDLTLEVTSNFTAKEPTEKWSREPLEAHVSPWKEELFIFNIFLSGGSCQSALEPLSLLSLFITLERKDNFLSVELIKYMN